MTAEAAAAAGGREAVVGGLVQDFHGHRKQSLLLTCRYQFVEIGRKGGGLSTLLRDAERIINPCWALPWALVELSLGAIVGPYLGPFLGSPLAPPLGPCWALP